MAERHMHRITIIELGAPNSRSVQEELGWICRSFDLDPKRDQLAFEIFLHLLDKSRKGEGVKTIDITKTANVTQAAIVYHMNAFLNSGLVVKKGAKYYLRGGTLGGTMAEIENDMLRRMRMMREMAKRIDEQMI